MTSTERDLGEGVPCLRTVGMIRKHGVGTGCPGGRFLPSASRHAVGVRLSIPGIGLRVLVSRAHAGSEYGTRSRADRGAAARIARGRTNRGASRRAGECADGKTNARALRRVPASLLLRP